MKNIILACSLFLLMNIVSAAPTCTTPEPSAIIYFGNRINTDRGSARSSLSRMAKELTNKYQIRKILTCSITREIKRFCGFQLLK